MKDSKGLVLKILNAGGLPPRRHRKAITDDEVELVLGWFYGHVETADLVHVYGGGPTPAVYRVAGVLRDLLATGDIVELLDFRPKEHETFVEQPRVKGPKEDLRPGDPGYDPAFDVNAAEDD